MKNIDLREFIKDLKLKPMFLDLIKWKLIDLYRLVRYGRKVHLYGVRCVTAMYGCGKTMSMTYLALNLREKYKNEIYICSNYGLSIQDFPFTSIKQLTDQYDKPVVFFWDEVQNDFPATDKVFPKPVRQALTLNRKGNGKMIYWASQDHELVHKTIRRLTIEYGETKTLFGRLTRIKWYRKDDYQKKFEELDIKKKMKIHPFKKQKFIQTDKMRNMYNSYGWDNGEKLEN